MKYNEVLKEVAVQVEKKKSLKNLLAIVAWS